MLTAKIPAAIAAATGLPEYWVRRVLRRLREFGCIPSGRAPRLNSVHVARVIFGLSAAAASGVPSHVARMEALPNRFLPAEGGKTASTAVADLVDGLTGGATRQSGRLELNTSWGAVTVYTINADGHEEVLEFGSGDHGVHPMLAATTTLPLVAVRRIADALLDH